MGKESEFTTQILASLRRAGAADVVKISDMPHFKGQRTRFDIKKPCDIVGTLPNGRSLRIEVKQAKASEKTGRPFAFNPNAKRGDDVVLPQHQRDALRETHELGGISALMLVSWLPRTSWTLYVWTWPELSTATDGLTRPIEQSELMATPGLARLKPGDLGWDLSDHVSSWCLSDLVYLSCPFGGKEANLHCATEQLAWAHGNTPWGLRVQAPWISSAFAELSRGTTEEQWRASGGIDVERAVLRGYGALLHAGHDGHGYSAGQRREAIAIIKQGGRVFERRGDEVTETTSLWKIPF